MPATKKQTKKQPSVTEKHIIEEQQRFAEMEEELKWYEKALGKKKKK